MSRRQGELQIASGAVWGVGAYLLGLGVLVGADLIGFQPTSGVWGRSSGGLDLLLVHLGAHLPIWQCSPQWELIPYTVVLAIVLVVAGFGRTKSVGPTSESAVQTGQLVVVGYSLTAVLASAVLVVGDGSVTVLRMVGPAILVGVFFPALFGGIGGLLAVQSRK